MGVEKTLVHNVITSSVEGFVKYKHDNWTYYILLEQNEWVICIAESGYAFYNNEFFTNLFSYISLPRPNHEKHIKSWVKEYLKEDKVDKHFYPDHLYGEYNWTNQFNVPEVLEKGKLIQ